MSFVLHTLGLETGRARTPSRSHPERGWDDRPLSVRSRRHGGLLVIEVIGTLTLWNLDAFALALSPAADALTLPRVTVVDLRAVDLIDNSGLALLVGLSKRLRSPETPLAPRVLVTAGRQPDRALHRGRYGKILDIVSDAAPEAGV